jgi:hypothetical protein
MSNDESGRRPGTFNNVPIQFNNPFDAVRPDMSAENAFIANQGIRFFHYVSVVDPLYQVQSGDVRHSFDQEENAQFEDTGRFHRENGFIYFKKGIVYGIFTGNSKDLRYLSAGLYTDSGATLSLNRYYEGTEEYIKISENDKLIPCELPKEFFTTISHKFDHNPTGIDRMQFRPQEVTHLIDSAGIVYVQDEDFKIANGVLRWIDGRNRPGIDPLSGSGRVCGIRYTYKPFYYIKMILHDIRIKPHIDPISQEVTTKAGPVLVNIVADWVYLQNRTQNANAVDAVLEAGDTSNTGPR